MSDPIDDPKLLALWAAGTKGLRSRTDPRAYDSGSRERLMAAVETERYLPFCSELARHVDLPEGEVRALLARGANPTAWTRGVLPVVGYIDFDPGPRVAPLRAGFVRLLGGARLPRHEHIDRELTFVLEGALVDDSERTYTPGSVIDMPVGSAHALSVPEGGSATVVLLHGGIRSA
jgi:putative transcriptional regulator